jgi:hypothetical protein
VNHVDQELAYGDTAAFATRLPNDREVRFEFDGFEVFQMGKTPLWIPRSEVLRRKVSALVSEIRTNTSKRRT